MRSALLFNPAKSQQTLALSPETMKPPASQQEAAV
jgi:hypothetical protein